MDRDLSKNATSWGSFTYKQDEDALRVNVKPQAAEMHDALAYDFDDVKAGFDGRYHAMGESRGAVQGSCQCERSCDGEHSPAMHGLNQYYWEGWDDAAGYFLANKINLDEALKDEDHVDSSGRAL